MSEIDWNVELRKIEREFDGLPPEPSPSALRAQKEAELRARQRAAQRVALAGAWARLILVAALAGALWWWPNAHACDLDLAGFLAAEAMVVVGGLWIAAFTWRHRLAFSHGVALALFVAGLSLVAVQVLPRLGYATVAGVNASGWRCGG
ncbi:MAG TPA: hypothetical protein VFJ74_17980 [Gemmatimonadaceae bacterium]|nr:hypothetical protein [Gemmatimonadaceae bacterium]